MNLLVTGAWGTAEENINKLKQQGHSVLFMQQEMDKMPCVYSWVEGVICNGLFQKHPIEQFINLKYIQLTSAGFDRVPMDYVQKHNIKIFNARGVYSIPMAEYAVAGVLQLYKQSVFFRQNQKKHIWEKHRGLLELSGKTVCIIGCGSVGTECAKRFAAFGCNVIGVDICPKSDENYHQIFALDELDTVLYQSDVLVLTLPLTEKTKYLIDSDRFKFLKTGAVLVNISRGAIIDSSALIQNLNKLRGVVLDVFEEEPLSEESLLWEAENVIITPHNSFVGENNQKRLLEVIVENLRGNNI